MTMEVAVIVKSGKGEPKTYQLTQTSEAIEKTSKDGSKHWTLAHFQPASESKVVMPFSKLYIDTQALNNKGK